MDKKLEQGVKELVAFYLEKSGLKVKEIWYAPEVGVVIRYSLNEEIKEAEIRGSLVEKSLNKVIEKYSRQKGAVIKIEVETEIKIVQVLPGLNGQ